MTLTAILLCISSVKAQGLNSFIASDSKKTTTKLYSVAQLKSLLNSNKVACFSFKRKAYLSKGYIKKLGSTKDFCSAKASKAYGITRLNKDNLTLQARITLNKQ